MSPKNWHHSHLSCKLDIPCWFLSCVHWSAPAWLPAQGPNLCSDTGIPGQRHPSPGFDLFSSLLAHGGLWMVAEIITVSFLNHYRKIWCSNTKLPIFRYLFNWTRHHNSKWSLFSWFWQLKQPVLINHKGFFEDSLTFKNLKTHCICTSFHCVTS